MINIDKLSLLGDIFDVFVAEEIPCLQLLNPKNSPDDTDDTPSFFAGLVHIPLGKQDMMLSYQSKVSPGFIPIATNSTWGPCLACDFNAPIWAQAYQTEIALSPMRSPHANFAKKFRTLPSRWRRITGEWMILRSFFGKVTEEKNVDHIIYIYVYSVRCVPGLILTEI